MLLNQHPPTQAGKKIKMVKVEIQQFNLSECQRNPELRSQLKSKKIFYNLGSFPPKQQPQRSYTVNSSGSVYESVEKEAAGID